MAVDRCPQRPAGNLATTLALVRRHASPPLPRPAYLSIRGVGGAGLEQRRQAATSSGGLKNDGWSPSRVLTINSCEGKLAMTTRKEKVSYWTWYGYAASRARWSGAQPLQGMQDARRLLGWAGLFACVWRWTNCRVECIPDARFSPVASSVRFEAATVQRLVWWGSCGRNARGTRQRGTFAAQASQGSKRLRAKAEAPAGSSSPASKTHTYIHVMPTRPALLSLVALSSACDDSLPPPAAASHRW